MQPTDAASTWTPFAKTDSVLIFEDALFIPRERDELVRVLSLLLVLIASVGIFWDTKSTTTISLFKCGFYENLATFWQHSRPVEALLVVCTAVTT